VKFEIRQGFYWCVDYEIKGYPTPNRTWYFNGEKLLYSNDITDVLHSSGEKLKGERSKLIPTFYRHYLCQGIPCIDADNLFSAQVLWNLQVRVSIGKATTLYPSLTFTDLPIKLWQLTSINSSPTFSLEFLDRSLRCYPLIYHFRRQLITRIQMPILKNCRHPGKTLRKMTLLRFA
jgi:hypothetical protein